MSSFNIMCSSKTLYNMIIILCYLFHIAPITIVMSRAEKEAAMQDVFRKYKEQTLVKSYSEYNNSLKDVDEMTYINLSFDDVQHLREAVFPTPAFPVIGRSFAPNMKMAVPLVFREFYKPESKTLNVWCILDTTSVYTCLSVKTLEAFFGEGNVKDDKYFFAIQNPICPIEVYVSKVGSDFEHANILGMDALRSLRVSTTFNLWKREVRIVNDNASA